MFRASPSQALRGSNFLITSGKQSIYHQPAAQLVDKLLKEFATLVRETPQWTGTTAASWYIGFYEDEPTINQVYTQPDRTAKEALCKGTEPACAISINKSKYTLTNVDLAKIARTYIVVGNDAPGYETAEEGPVRFVNSPPRALERFMARVSLMDFEVDFYK